MNNLIQHRMGVIALLLFLVLMPACNKDSTEPGQQGNPPELPPLSSMLIDFSDFDTTAVLSPASAPMELALVLQTQRNWRWAALNVGVWNLALTITLAAPVASFVEAFNHTPEQQSDGRWLWEYNFFVAGIRHTAKLYGGADNNEIEWQMLISRQGGYTDFEWYTGESDLLATEGAWHLKRSPNNPTPFLEIDWERNLQNDTANIRYTNVTPGVNENGDFIFYGITTDTPYNAFYRIFDQDADNLIIIEWDRTPQQKNGRIQDPRFFQDSEWHCWDTVGNGLVDIDCP